MNMFIRKNWIYVLALATITPFGAVLAQDKPANYPTRPIRIIISSAPGAGGDMIARMNAEILRDAWGQNVVVDSRPGGSGAIATNLAVRAEPDGYTLIQAGYNLLLRGASKRVDFDVLTAFEPVVRTNSQPYILIVHPRVTAHSVKELIPLSKQKTLTYAGSSGAGSTVHIGMSRLARVSGISMKYVAYKGTAPSILALMGGEIDMVAAASLSAVGAIKTGKARGLVNLGEKRVSALPDLPTLAEQGYPGIVVDNTYHLAVPARTPRPIILAINKVVGTALTSPKYRQRLESVGAEAVDPMPPEQLKKLVAKEYAEIETTLKELGIKL
jgi:tripartite-type tricarboxylate transporter receptor subunit TctC